MQRFAEKLKKQFWVQVLISSLLVRLLKLRLISDPGYPWIINHSGGYRISSYSDKIVLSRPEGHPPPPTL
jgi:hypothetical protein